MTGGAGPLVICSDCYDNANIYSRTREYCPYAYLGDEDPLDKSLPGLKESLGEHDQHKDTVLESLITNQDSSVFFTSHEQRLSSHTPLDRYTNGETWQRNSIFTSVKQIVVIIMLRWNPFSLATEVQPAESSATTDLLLTSVNMFLCTCQTSFSEWSILQMKDFPDNSWIYVVIRDKNLPGILILVRNVI